MLLMQLNCSSFDITSSRKTVNEKMAQSNLVPHKRILKRVHFVPFKLNLAQEVKCQNGFSQCYILEPVYLPSGKKVPDQFVCL